MGEAILGQAYLGEKMRIVRRIFAAVIVVMILSLIYVIPVFAAAYITGFSAIPTDTTMSLKWVKATGGYQYTLIRQSTTDYPVSPTGGDGTTVYPDGVSTGAISVIVKGLVALLLKIYSDRTPHEILTSEPRFIDEIGLRQHLSPTRSNGLLAMVKQMKLYALAYEKIAQKNN